MTQQKLNEAIELSRQSIEALRREMASNDGGLMLAPRAILMSLEELMDCVVTYVGAVALKTKISPEEVCLTVQRILDSEPLKDAWAEVEEHRPW